MKTNLFIFLSTIIVAGCVVSGLINNQKPNLLVNSEVIVQEIVKEQNVLHQKALLAIKNEFNVSEDDWNAMLQYIDKLKADDTLCSTLSGERIQADSPFIAKVHKILADYHINPSRVIIKNLHGPEYKAQAFQQVDEDGTIIHILELNSEWLDNYAPEIQEGMLRHEIMHLLNYDCLEESYLLGLLETLGYQQKEYATKESIINYRRHREIRADLLASCSNLEIADALRYYYAACALESDHYKPQTWNTHPKDSQRAQELAQLVNTINTTAIQA